MSERLKGIEQRLRLVLSGVFNERMLDAMVKEIMGPEPEVPRVSSGKGGKFWTLERDEQIARLYADGLDYREIGNAVGVSRSSVAVRLHVLRKSLSTWNTQAEQTLMSLRAHGKSWDEIASDMGLSVTSVCIRARLLLVRAEREAAELAAEGDAR